VVSAAQPSSSVPRHPFLSWLSTRLERCSDRVGAKAVPPAGHPSLEVDVAFVDKLALGALVKAWQWPAQQVPSWLVVTPGMSLGEMGCMGGDGEDAVVVSEDDRGLRWTPVSQSGSRSVRIYDPR